MVDIEKIKADIEALRTLNAEEYCREQVAKIYEDFENSRASKIEKLESALSIYDEYQIIEESEKNEICETVEGI